MTTSVTTRVPATFLSLAHQNRGPTPTPGPRQGLGGPQAPKTPASPWEPLSPLGGDCDETLRARPRSRTEPFMRRQCGIRLEPQHDITIAPLNLVIRVTITYVCPSFFLSRRPRPRPKPRQFRSARARPPRGQADRLPSLVVRGLIAPRQSPPSAASACLSAAVRPGWDGLMGGLGGPLPLVHGGTRTCYKRRCMAAHLVCGARARKQTMIMLFEHELNSKVSPAPMRNPREPSRVLRPLGRRARLQPRSHLPPSDSEHSAHMATEPRTERPFAPPLLTPHRMHGIATTGVTACFGDGCSGGSSE